MFKSTLIVSTALMMLPTLASAQVSDYSLHNKLDTQKIVQTAELAPVTLASLDVENSQISTPLTPSQALTFDGAVEAPVQIIQYAQSSAQADKPSSATKDMMKSSTHSAWTDILQTYVAAPDSMGVAHFDYKGLKANTADKAKLDGYIKSLEAMDPNSMNENEAIAFGQIFIML
ncbi:hypothetical protein N9W89_14530 [Hellea sp.]|nr:hypothetical protein [Hellea sp.]